MVCLSADLRTERADALVQVVLDACKANGLVELAGERYEPRELLFAHTNAELWIDAADRRLRGEWPRVGRRGGER